MKVPVRLLYSSISMCWMPPVPEEAYENLPWEAFSVARKSLWLVGPNLGFTASTFGVAAMLITGVKSVRVL